MVVAILQNTPLWVWPLLLGLLALGLLQTRRRRVARPFVLMLPAIMVPLSLYAVATSFGVGFGPLGAWAIGLVVAVAINGSVLLGPTGVRYSVDDQKFELPGSWVPLALIMTIFCTRFVLGVTTALNPAIIGTESFVGCVSAVLGICSGLFLSRAMRTLSVRHRTTAA